MRIKSFAAAGICATLVSPFAPSHAQNPDTSVKTENLEHQLDQLEPQVSQYCFQIQDNLAQMKPCSEVDDGRSGVPSNDPPSHIGPGGWTKGYKRPPYDPSADALENLEKRFNALKEITDGICPRDQNGLSVIAPCWLTPPPRQKPEGGSPDAKIKNLERGIQDMQHKLKDVCVEDNMGSKVIRPCPDRPSFQKPMSWLNNNNRLWAMGLCVEHYKIS